MINQNTLVNALNKALDSSGSLSGTYEGQVKMLYQNPSRNPKAISFPGGNFFLSPELNLATGHRVTFSGNVPAELATGTFYAIISFDDYPRVANSLANALAGVAVNFTPPADDTIPAYVFDLDIQATDPSAVLETYAVPTLAAVVITKSSTTFTNGKAIAAYTPATINGQVGVATPVTHSLTYFGGYPGLGYDLPIFDLTPATQPSIPAGGSLTVIVNIEAEAVAS